MSRTLRILIAAIVAVAAVGGYWKLVLAPKRAQAADLAQQVDVQRAQLAQTQNLIATYRGAKDDYKANYATVVRLGKAVPANDDTRSLVLQLDTAAKRSGVAFETINVNGGGSSSDTTGAAPAAPGAVSAGNFSAMPFTFSFSGRFDTLGSFFSRLERFVSLKGDQILVNGRLLRVERIQLDPADTGWPALTAQVGASSYIVPEATDPGPATGSTATSTTSTAAQPASGTTGTEIR